MAKILIIDDELKLRETICELLTFVGYDVHKATNGIDGLTKVKKIKPDLILCDITMPELDGYGFMEHHQNSEYSIIPVLLLSANVEFKNIKKGIALGAKGYIKKPFAFKELKEIIESNLLTNK
ncbi:MULTISPECIES: response regulator [Flavobacterium]|uniref:Response regulator n=1 Tax=Flavobacterium algoritolerans TaxID=3041254 RepID=A0ABT6V5R7_9FLAO|nr:MULTISPECIES: response regulator [Flavobacterium]MDI5886566.1 response regulator [Flavobacterium yafengii]MDI5893579.1 response regulator [Flavobacterium algoritolerans]